MRPLISGASMISKLIVRQTICYNLLFQKFEKVDEKSGLKKELNDFVWESFISQITEKNRIYETT